MALLARILLFLKLLVMVPLDLITGRRARRYSGHTMIAAPVEIVWDVLKNSEQTFEGFVPLSISQYPRQDDPAVYDVQVRVGDELMVMVLREHVCEPMSRIVSEILPDGTDPRLLPGDHYVIETRLSETPDGTRLALDYDVQHTNLAGRLSLPLSVAGSLERMRRQAEKRAGSLTTQPSWVPYRDAFATGVLTLLSFWWLIDFSFAAILVAVLLLHELGHVLAMRWCGLQVRGLYFVPFLGALVVGGAPFLTQARRGFIALMGPAASMVPTCVFLLLAHNGFGRVWHDLALISLVINGFNLLPVLPLDGGQILAALVSRVGLPIQKGLHLVLLAAAGWFAYRYHAYVTLAFIAVITVLLALRPMRKSQVAPIDVRSGVWLTTAYLATLGFYVAAFLALVDPSNLPGL